MLNKQKTSIALGILCLFLLFGNFYWYYKSYIDIAPNHPNSKYRQLFPGINITMVSGPDFDQYLAHSFVFLIEDEESQSENKVSYRLALIGRAGCEKLTSVPLSQEQSLNLEPYQRKAILVKKYERVGEDGAVLLKKIDNDEFVNEHISEYKKACSFAFQYFGI